MSVLEAEKEEEPKKVADKKSGKKTPISKS
jgi:hypothetical protein